MVNFDNSATSFPKPDSVRQAVMSAFTRYGGNPGRGGHRLSAETAEAVYSVREQAAQLFAAEPENTAFTSNCTLALNMAIKGMMQNGGHIIISGYEHNAVLRPVHTLAKRRIASYSAAPVSDDDDETLENIRSLIRSDTKCVCCTAASNVTGRILPYRRIAELCKSYGLCFIVDAAQAAGLLDISLNDGMNFICTAGHKALYGPSGTGLLVSDGRFTLSTVIEGGTGATSSEPEQTPFAPERYESGTVNTAGILGLGAGIRFVRSKGTKNILAHELSLCDRLEEGLRRVGGVKLYPCERRVPVVSFNIGEFNAQAVSARLSDKGFMLRGGLHCAPLAHRAIGTLGQGTVRFSPSVFSTRQQTDALVRAVAQTAAELGKGL